jgi:hypothetical protein
LKLLKQKFVTTKDNFHPSYDNDCVLVSLYKIDKNKYTISVWGDDDFGLEIFIKSNPEAYYNFNKIEDGVTISFLKNKGFQQA